MKVLLINGSPHEKGCTYTALCAVAAALNESGVDTEILWTGAEPIRGCTGCRGCSKTHRCVFDDGMVNAVIERMEKADGLVVGGPVHYASAGGALVSLLDRVFYAAGGAFHHKPGASVVSARRAGTTAALEVLDKYFQISQMPVVSSRYWNMVHGNSPEEVQRDVEGMEIMTQLGRNMAWLLRCIEAGKACGLEPPETGSKSFTNFIR